MKFRLMLRRWLFGDVPGAQERFEHEARGHDWEIVGVEHNEMPEITTMIPLPHMMTKQITTVLRRCTQEKCGEFGTVSLAGHWRLDQLQGATNKEIVERFLADPT